MESQKDKLLRLWKARQEAEGHDVSGVNTLEEAKHFFDKKEASKPPEAPAATKEPKSKAPKDPNKQKSKAPKDPNKQKSKAPKKPKEE